MKFEDFKDFKGFNITICVALVLRLILHRSIENVIFGLKVIVFGIIFEVILIKVFEKFPSRSEINKYKKSSPVIEYLNTMFDDISHINATSGNSGIKFCFAQIDLNENSAMRLYLSSDKKRIDFIQKYHEYVSLWYKGESQISPGELRKVVSPLYFSYDRDGYKVKNIRFRKELEEDFLYDCKLDSLGWNDSLMSFFVVSSGHDLSRPIAIKAITECAEEHGFMAIVETYNDEYCNGESDILRINF